MKIVIERVIIFGLLLFIIYFISAVAHERDLSINFNETGDAKAWFFEIKCK